jgi:predicted methyltransferase
MIAPGGGAPHWEDSMISTTFRGALAAASLALAAALAPGVGPAFAQDYKAVLAAPDRSEADRKNDDKRDALKLLEFTAPKTGWKVLDMGAGAGYSTELMARAVGPTGQVWGQNDKESERLAARAKALTAGRITPIARPFDDPAPPDAQGLDLITFFFAYHDTTYMPVDRVKMDKAMFAALKPGGFLVIADHAANPGEGATVGKTLHRIEEKTLIAEIVAAGFKHVATGDFLRNPDDPRTVSVHKSGIRNDEFVLRFQKPN